MSPTSAFGQDEASKNEARRLYGEATQAFKEKRYPEAALGFEAAHKLRRHAVALYTAAQAWEAAGNAARAADAYNLALETPTLNSQQASRARQQLAKLKKQVGTIVVAGEEESRVQLDDHMELAIPARIHGAPGSHALIIVRSDGSVDRRTLTLNAGESVEIDADAAEEKPSETPEKIPLAPPVKKPVRVIEADRPSDSSRIWKTAGYATAGAGLAALAGATVLGLSAKDAETTFNESPTSSTFNHASDLQTRTNIMFAVGGVLTAAGVGIVVWQTLSPSKEKKTVSAQLTMGPRGVFAQGRF